MTIPDGVMLLEPQEVYNQALVGFTDKPKDKWPRKTQTLVAVYSSKKCVELLMKTEGWDRSEALEWFHYNTSGTWAGERTPTFKR